MIKKSLNRKMLRKMKRHAVSALVALMVSQSVAVSWAAVPQTVFSEQSENDESANKKVEEGTMASEDEKQDENTDTSKGEESEGNESNLDDEKEESKDTSVATPSDATPPSENGADDDTILDNDMVEDTVREEEELEKATSSDATPNIFHDMPKIGSDEFTEWFFVHVNSEDVWDWVLNLMQSEDTEDEDVKAFLDWFKKNEEKVAEAYQKFFGVALMSNSTGDLWKDWTGNTSWNGDGTENNPYEISELSDLCGLSEMVAAGNDFEGQYFALMQDIDLGSITVNSGNWNPIGWYQNKADFGNAVSNKFKGNFDGNRNSITGLKIASVANTLNNVGLFGAVDGGSIKNLTIEADGGVRGGDNVGILAGSVTGDTIIYNVRVENSSISAAGDAGGLIGEVTGKTYAKAGTVTIENCTADGIVIQSQNTNGYVGGIAGNVQKANIIDSVVRTYDGGSNRIQGTGYIGGVVGRLNKTNVYNSYVDGTIGGNGAQAIGGIVGKYDSGNLVLARFAGTIAKSNQGTAAREGTFVGTRDAANNFTYGTGKSDNISYLFTTNASMAKKVFGSNIDKDNTFSTDAHIGYWQDDERKFHLVAGSVDKEIDMFYYEELEAAVKHIVVSKLGNSFSTDEYWDGCDFKLDHFAPNSYGAPIRGHLVSVPRIDTRNADGSYDSDVATLTAIGKTSNSYYKQITKDTPSAIAPGDVVQVGTAPNNKNGNTYQMVYDETQPGKVQPPTYTDENGNITDMNYVNGGTYTFTMPEADTELNVEYIKVTTQLTMTPAETTLKVVHTRAGDRKNPQITTVVYDEHGNQIAKYIGDTSQVTPNPITIHAEHNGVGSSSDRTVKWSVDNANLLTMTNVDTSSYTLKDAYIMPNLNSNFIIRTINKKVQEQVDSGYANAIDNTIYSDVATVTASTNPDTSVNNISVVGNTRINVEFQIIDNTTRRVEGLNLNYSDISITVTRKLTGDRTHPVETIICDQPTVLAATLYPEQPFNKNVRWTWNDSFVTTGISGDHQENCAVGVRYDSNGISNPAWIQNVINSDNQKRVNDKYVKLNGSATLEQKVVATADDQTHGTVSSACNVVINFVTADETVIHPEAVEMSQENVKYVLSFTKAGDINSVTVKEDGFVTTNLDAAVVPDCVDDEEHKPYDRGVTWSVSDTDALTVDQDGNITPNKNAQWIKEAMKSSPYKATKTVEVYATANDKTNSAVGKTMVTLEYVTNCIELDKENMDYNLSHTMKGDIKSEIVKSEGFDARTLIASVYPDGKAVTWSSSDTDAVTVSENGNIVVNADAQWIKEAMGKAPYTAAKTVTISAQSGDMVDTCTLKLTYKTNCVEFPADTLTYNIGLSKSGNRNNPTYKWTGADAQKFTALPYPDKTATVTYATSNIGILTIGKDGTVLPVLDVNSEWMKPAMSNPYTAAVQVIVSATSGNSTDECVVILNLKVTDTTHSSGSSSGGGGGGGGGGGSSSGGPKGTATIGGPASLPDYVVKGTWESVKKDNDTKWQFKAGTRTYVNEWAAVYNPYANTSNGQSAFDWFRFDEHGYMITGWYTDVNGDIFYLNPVSDNTRGRMFTSWNWICGADGKSRCYYFNPVSDGSRGKLMKNTTIKDDGNEWTVNANGEWTINGMIQVR